MNIAFDAKRAFLNPSGLGNYSRTLIRSLVRSYPSNLWALFTPTKGSSDFSTFIGSHKNATIVQPQKLLDKKISSRWRSYGITRLLEKNKIDVYHGLSNELPFNIKNFKGKKIVTIHDLLFLRYPKLYPLFDRKLYDKKSRSACELADIIVAVSEQTKNDIVEFYSIDPKKIKVVYQSCDEAFYKKIPEESTNKIKEKYHLPDKYLLYVGTIEERKNLLSLVQALTIVKNIPLVVIGKKKAYFKKIQRFITANKLGVRVIFPKNISNEDIPAIYKGAQIFIYPSLFEGFGIPIIEALSSGTPVITTRGGCFAEAGGPGSAYIEPTKHEQIASEIQKILSSPELRKSMIEQGFEHSKRFLPEVIASEMMNLYIQK